MSFLLIIIIRRLFLLSQTTDNSSNFVGPLEFEITRVDCMLECINTHSSTVFRDMALCSFQKEDENNI